MKNIRFDESGKSVIILDQSLLPGEEKYIELKTITEMEEAIKALRVRGAPAIGIFAAFALAALGRQEASCKAISSCCGASRTSDDVFLQKLLSDGERLKASRPTAVNLAWAVDRVTKAVRIEIYKAQHSDPNRIYLNAGASKLADILAKEAMAIYEEDKSMCRSIAEHGLTLVKEGDGILTHCNAGPLATSEYGTALGPIILGSEKGLKFKVFADETRPLLQGARLTAYELEKAGVDVTLICDNMASAVMKNAWVQAVFVGCDRIAANGDVANKIGTSGVAVLADYYGIPFYVLGPSSTIDSDCPSGKEIPIEERDGKEISKLWFSEPMAPEEISFYNPAFDVTDHSLISAIVTEKGIIYPPYSFEKE